ncbi:MAG: methylmalonyl Co-A mutase-associated GTPase MeaB [Chitinophagaceae bacterium]|nr:methylmalonyl Co-A mutase-associated GTPase MeaB [Chitinophagaceae bacterium]
MWQQLLLQLQAGDRRALARCISLVENEQEGYMAFLQALPSGQAPVIGITGPPGAGKSSLADALIGALTGAGKKVGIICVDPSSPFNQGAVLGDRIRMNRWFNHPDVYIRSLASRGSLGGLNQMIIEITAVLQAVGFDYILIETVGIGQSEVEIAGLADTTVVVLVPESGDEVQNMKSGLMEVADIFVVNKSDRPDADHFIKNLRGSMQPGRMVPVIKTVAISGTGIPELLEQILQHQARISEDKKVRLLAIKAVYILQRLQLKAYDLEKFSTLIRQQLVAGNFNLFRFIRDIKLNRDGS